MYKVISKNSSQECPDLSAALEYAKTVDEFVTITDGLIEIVGKFGADSIKQGVCPDGLKYDWNKASRIGRMKRERT